CTAANASTTCPTLLPSAANVSTWTCPNGVCQIGACAKGFINCGAAAPFGCNVNKLTDPNNCGACNTVCNIANSIKDTCSNGVCLIGNCPSNCSSSQLSWP